MTTIFFIFLFLLYYVFDGYLRVLQILSFLFPATKQTVYPLNEFPSITVLITVHNEEGLIEKKINNVLESEYPGKIDLIIASDGSTDKTESIVKNLNNSKITFFQSNYRLGKSATQNLAVELATGNILVFTDAETMFKKKSLLKLTEPFSDPNVGAVDGHVVFSSEQNSISTNQSYYWRYEMMLRKLESKLGMLAVASGAFMAIRRELFRKIRENVGEDCVIPLDIVSRGYRIVHVPEAIVSDRHPSETLSEFKSRVRMTSRNWAGTWSYPTLLNPLSKTKIAFALWSHKILRWLSPFYMISLTLLAYLIYRQNDNPLYLYVLILFYLLGALGFIAEVLGQNILLIGSIYSFILANLGFLFGLLSCFIGKKVTAYKITKTN